MDFKVERTRLEQIHKIMKSQHWTKVVNAGFHRSGHQKDGCPGGNQCRQLRLLTALETSNG
ncbi:MAG TPA: hypothetical protein DF715_03435, partial [Oceanicaulis sp.]|nr:hypothetical protein [Oceanicaulis sp.]